jgi:hypothetical protein
MWTETTWNMREINPRYFDTDKYLLLLNKLLFCIIKPVRKQEITKMNADKCRLWISDRGKRRKKEGG